VALFVKKHFVKEMKEMSAFKTKDYKKALEDTFFQMDDLMKTKEGEKELIKFMKADAEGEESMAGCTATTILVTPT
jgi:hypothetical protein